MNTRVTFRTRTLARKVASLPATPVASTYRDRRALSPYARAYSAMSFWDLGSP